MICLKAIKPPPPPPPPPPAAGSAAASAAAAFRVTSSLSCLARCGWPQPPPQYTDTVSRGGGGGCRGWCGCFRAVLVAMASFFSLHSDKKNKIKDTFRESRLISTLEMSSLSYKKDSFWPPPVGFQLRGKKKVPAWYSCIQLASWLWPPPLLSCGKANKVEKKSQPLIWSFHHKWKTQKIVPNFP